MSVRPEEWSPAYPRDEVIPPSPTPPDPGDDVHVWPGRGRSCLGLLGWIFGHKYEARYDSKLPVGLSVERGHPKLLDAMKDSTYRGDVCRRCGHVVNEQRRGTE